MELGNPLGAHLILRHLIDTRHAMASRKSMPAKALAHPRPRNHPTWTGYSAAYYRHAHDIIRLDPILLCGIAIVVGKEVRHDADLGLRFAALDWVGEGALGVGSGLAHLWRLPGATPTRFPLLLRLYACDGHVQRCSRPRPHLRETLVS